jgi:hypothetical protein
MKNRLFQFLTELQIALVITFLPVTAKADVFATLAAQAGAVGGRLRQTGYLIAGFGLVAVSLAAIFNKISWKALAYIMLSCFTLTCMTYVVTSFQKGGDTSWVGGVAASSASFNDESIDPSTVTVSK